MVIRKRGKRWVVCCKTLIFKYLVRYKGLFHLERTYEARAGQPRPVFFALPCWGSLFFFSNQGVKCACGLLVHMITLGV
jgi:hypothetical protein